MEILKTKTKPPCSPRDELYTIMTTKYPDKFNLAISHTSRKKSLQDIDGVNYHFTSNEKIQEMIKVIFV